MLKIMMSTRAVIFLCI